FPGNALMGRALTAPWIHHAFYAGIILWEAGASGLLAWGAWKLWRARGGSPDEFHAAKAAAVAGLTLGALLWLVAFLTVGGEWFAMWQSSTWNGQTAAGRMLDATGIVLIFVAMRE